MALPAPEFKIVTDECLKEWKAANTAFKLPEQVSATRFLFELFWAIVRGDLPLQKCRAALDSVEFSDNRSKEELGSIIADVVAHLGQDLTLLGEQRTRLVKLAKWLVEASMVSSRLFQERCEEEFLWESEMSKIKAQELKAKEVRVNTRLLYQQAKFNLLREESEGYAKMVTLLCQVGLIPTISTATATISILKSLIGHFDLDPNRVFDIVLECFELFSESGTFYNLIPLFPKSHAAQILGFKFQYYQRADVNTPVPFSLYHLAALLVKADFIDLDTIYSHLLPSDGEALEQYETFVTRRFEEVNKIGKINLAATGKDLEDDKQDLTIDLFTALDMEDEAMTDRIHEFERSQKLGFLMGFLYIDDWYHAQLLFDRLSDLNPIAHRQICGALFRVIEKSISKTYDSICEAHHQHAMSSIDSSSDIPVAALGSLMQSSFIDLPRQLFQMLSAAGAYLHRDPILLQKVCRVLRAYYLSAQELIARAANSSESNSGDFKDRIPLPQMKEVGLRIEEALGTCLLPSLQLIPANPAVGQEIWGVLGLLPYEVRYRLYGEWEKDDEKIPMVLAARHTAKLDTRRLLKRLAKENLKQLGRMVAKLAHANPMTVLRTIVHQIEAYRDMITPVVDAFKYLTQLEYDILEYVVIERLAQGGREKLKDDGLNLSDWLQSLALFWGCLCKKYPSMELRGLFQYLVNQLKRGIGIELVLLQELIQQMANLQYTENMTEEQLDSMAGSETLRCLAASFGIPKTNKALSKSTNRLRDSLFPQGDSNLAFPLLLLIGQHRTMVVVNADAPYIKMVSEQFDRCHGILLQYAEFLTSTISPATTYAQLIPSLDDLIHKYHLDPEVAFLIYRPVMRLFKCSRGNEVFWPQNFYEDHNHHGEDNSGESSNSNNEASLNLGPSYKPIMWSDLLATVQSTLPAKAWNSLSPDLYATFWGLTLYDLYVPRSRYEIEISKQHSAIKSLEELSDNSSIAITKRKKDKERIQELLDRLTSELEKHERHVQCVKQCLSREKDTWLTSCPDTSKINVEFLQRCIFPRCVFSLPDAVYCSMFVQMLHSLGTPFFNTVNHIDVLICKMLQPMICCCTEFEAGRLGRFFYETLKMAYHWKSDEYVYEQECGNMPGFAVYYRDPNSLRVTFSQFVRVHWKWSTRITRLLAQCLESSEYMEIRNALIVLTKISSVFPVIRKSGINLEKRVAKIKVDDREDLKVLATGVSAALAARKNSWVSEEEFGMGYIDVKPTASSTKSMAGNASNNINGSVLNAAQTEAAGARISSVNQSVDLSSTINDQTAKTKVSNGRLETQPKNRTGQSTNGSDSAIPSPGASVFPYFSGTLKNADDPTKSSVEEVAVKLATKVGVEPEVRPVGKRAGQSTSSKQIKLELVKEDLKSSKLIARSSQVSSSGALEKDLLAQNGKVVAISSDSTIAGQTPSLNLSTSARSVADTHGNTSRMEKCSSRTTDDLIADESRPQKRTAPTEEDRLVKYRRAEGEGKDIDSLEPRLLDRDKTLEAREEQNLSNKILDKSKEKAGDRYDKEHRDRVDRPEKSRGEDIAEKSRDRSMERHGRERSIERVLDRSVDKPREERNKDDKNKSRHSELSIEKSHSNERFHGQSLPPPPPLPPSFVPQSLIGGRREEDVDRRGGTSARHTQRLSPRHDERERRRSEEGLLATTQDDAKRKREDDLRERKRDERDAILMKVEERERDKASTLKDDDPTTAPKRRKLKRDHLTLSELGGDYGSGVHPPLISSNTAQQFDTRERGKSIVPQHRTNHGDEQVQRVHGKDAAVKITRREADQIHEREWEEEKRARAELKRARAELKRKHRT